MKMKTKTLLPMFVLIALLFVTGGASAQPLNKAEGSNAASVSLGTAFTYQGRLTDASGNPTPGPCDFQFSLWDAASSGAQVGSAQTKTNVSLNNGHFSAALDFGATAFQGEARYLQIAVRCPAGSGSYTALSGRVELTAAPYALSLRPGATIASVSGTALNLSGDPGLYASGIHYGVYAQSATSTGYGVYGLAAATSGQNIGVYGETKSPNGFGVFGKAPLTGGHGVYSYGDAHVEGNLTWKAKTGYVSVSAAAFQPVHSAYNYSNWGNGLIPSDSSSPWYYAAVQLPHGATVTSLAFNWDDTSTTNDATCTLYRNNMAGGGDLMASVSSSGSTGDGGGTDPTINNANVDNTMYAYYLEWHLPDANTAGYGVVIEYTFTGPY